MASIIVRNLDAKIHKRLKARAKRNGRSLEAELREILARASAEPAAVGEDAPAYEAGSEADWKARLRLLPGAPTIRRATKAPKFKAFRPLPQSGEPASEMVIRDRERF